MSIRTAILFCLIPLLASCGGMGGLGSKPEAIVYSLNAANSIKNSNHGLSKQLIVQKPKALNFISGVDIPVKSRLNDTYSFVPKAQWSDDLPLLVQTQIVRGLENAGALGRVGIPGESLRSDLLMLVEIRAFYLEETDLGLEAYVSFSAKIVNDRNGVVRAAKNFTNRAIVTNRTASGMMKALDQAFAPPLQELVTWSLKRF